MSLRRWRMASVHSSLSGYLACFQLIAALLLWVLLLAPVGAQDRRDEVRALMSFKEGNPFALRSSAGYWIHWNPRDENACAWFGVTCTANYTVSALDFSDWGLQGLNVQALSNLTDLRQLDLSSNNLGIIPDFICNLTGLIRLDLSRSNLFKRGIPPCILRYPSLRYLSLEGNQLSGEIPSLLGLVDLQYLFLGHNQFSGPFPKDLRELSRLAIVDLSYNALNGTIPALPKLANLLNLKLDGNNFSEFEEPWLLSANSSLEQLSVAFNQLEGRIPSGLENLPNLLDLNMSHNLLSGEIPLGFSQQFANKSFSLDLSQNRLTGGIPSDMLKQSGSRDAWGSVNLSYNLLVGDIPIDGANYWFFIVLDLSHNNLSGPIPFNMFSSPDTNFITYLWLQHNNLSGDIVDIMLQKRDFLQVLELRLQSNSFTGDLSRLANLTGFDVPISPIKVIDLSNNDLRWSTSEGMPDPIRATLKQLSTGSSLRLQEFRAGGNNFSGTSLPTSCFVNQTLAPEEPAFQVLDLSNSHLKGEILSQAFSSSCLPFVQVLNLSNNDITGSVPESIVQLPSLASLDVSNNLLSGPLPSIPFGSSLNNPSFFQGNVRLCGPPLLACPSGRGSGIQWWVWLVIIGGAMGIVVLSSLAIWQWRVYQKRHEQDADLIKTLMDKDLTALMSLRELVKATNNFADSARIGEGGFGTVYVGTLNNGTTVAIKRSKREGSEKDKEQFLNEVRILSHVNHRHLVKLLGCCLENKIAALVFEFVSNGTLHQHLEGKIGEVRLSWKQRLNIAVQSADALNYLHSGATFPIYHRDVKSSNILLDNDFNAKVADFGISKLAPMKATHVSTDGKGTIGYIDPEYYAFLHLTDKSDVYSFGVVLLELISGQPAIDSKKDEEQKSLVFFAHPHITSGDIQGLLDPTLIETFRDPTSHERESILNVGRLALKCVDMPSKARPSMNEVWRELQDLWLELHAKSNDLDSTAKNDNEDFPSDLILQTPNMLSENSSSVDMQSDHASGIEMSQCFER